MDYGVGENKMKSFGDCIDEFQMRNPDIRVNRKRYDKLQEFLTFFNCEKEYEGPWNVATTASGFSSEFIEMNKGKTVKEVQVSFPHFSINSVVPPGATLTPSGYWGWLYRSEENGGQGIRDFYKGIE